MPKRSSNRAANGGFKPKHKRGKRVSNPNKRKLKRGPKRRNEVPLVGGGDLANLEQMEDYYFGTNVNKDSMRSGGFRPDKRISDERNLPLRKRPVEFIKAKELYDPSHDLIKRLIEYNERKAQIETDSTDLKDVAWTSSDEIPDSPSGDRQTEKLEEKIPVESTSESEFDSDQGPDSNQGVDTPSRSREESPSADELHNDKLFYVDEEGDKDLPVRTIKVVEDPPVNATVNVKKCTQFEPTLTVGKVELALEENESGIVRLAKPQSSYHPFFNHIQNVMNNLDTDSVDEDVDFESDNSDGSVPRQADNSFLLMNSYNGSVLDNHWKSQEDLAHSSYYSKFDNSMKSLKIEDSKSSSFSSSLEKEHKSAPQAGEVIEFGLCEDDFAGSIGNLLVSNLRVGANSYSYYVSCQSVYGDSTSRWVDSSIMDDLMEELGLPDYRWDAYLKHVHSSFMEPEEEPEELPFDIDDSESDNSASSESYTHMTEDLGEDLDDLVSYTLKYSGDRNLEYDPPIYPAKGKGKHRRMPFGETTHIGTEVQSMLQNKLSTRETNKSKKRRSKDDFLSEEHARSADLLEKYPYGLHILNIKDEFDAFYRSNRQSVTFPPLDPHGNKVVGKFAYNYFMKSTTIGKGKNTKVYVEKTKKTKYNSPAYHIISQLVRQRPIFMRIDKKSLPESSYKRTTTIKVKAPSGKFDAVEGQIVGQHAPEIGSDNIGRKMLEKLGWNSGQGLGAHGNQGINEPIFAKVKKNKSGLRHTANDSQ